MTLRRSNLVDPGTAPYYHCISRHERGFYLMNGRPDSFQQAVAILGRTLFKGTSPAK